MSDVINLDEKRSKENRAPAFKDLPLNRPESASDTRFNNAFDVFGAVSSLGTRRQRDFLYEILWRYHFERRPISVDEMTEMMISYIRKNKKYFEKINGNSMIFNFDEVPNLQEKLRRINLCARKRKQPG